MTKVIEVVIDELSVLAHVQLVAPPDKSSQSSTITGRIDELSLVEVKERAFVDDSGRM